MSARWPNRFNERQLIILPFMWDAAANQVTEMCKMWCSKVLALSPFYSSLSHICCEWSSCQWIISDKGPSAFIHFLSRVSHCHLYQPWSLSGEGRSSKTFILTQDKNHGSMSGVVYPRPGMVLTLGRTLKPILPPDMFIDGRSEVLFIAYILYRIYRVDIYE